MGPQRRSVCCNCHCLSSPVLKVRERYVEDERKQEIAKNAKDDDEKRKRKGGKARRGISRL